MENVWQMTISAILFLAFITGSEADFSCSSNPENCTCADISGPVNIATLSGIDISLACYVTHTEGEEVQWIQGAVPLGSDPSIPCCDRYSMNTAGGNYSLIIRNVTVSDQNNYKCQIDDCALTKHSDEASLQVYVLPTGPVINNDVDGLVQALANETAELICNAYNAKPQATVRWYNWMSGDLLNSTVFTTATGSDETYNTKATYSFTPTAVDNQTTFKCVVFSEATKMTTKSFEREIALYVIGKPVLFTTGIANGSEITIDENDSQQVTCEATSTTSNANIAWFRENEQLFTNTSFVGESSDYNVSNAIVIKGSEANEGAMYRCVITVPGYTTAYKETLDFTVSIYTFPYALVIGCSVGGFLLLLLIIILIIVCVRRSKKKKNSEQEEREQREIQTVIANANADEQVEEEEVVPKEVVEAQQAQNNNPGYITDSEVDRQSNEQSSTSDNESHSYESANLPSGDTFSLSSSMRRSDRGSPVIMYSDLDENSTYSANSEQVALPSITGSMPIYHTKKTGTVMLTDV